MFLTAFGSEKVFFRCNLSRKSCYDEIVIRCIQQKSKLFVILSMFAYKWHHQQKRYLCASFRMLGVPSNKLERLSGATIKTLAILETKRVVGTVRFLRMLNERSEIFKNFRNLHAQQFKFLIHGRSIKTAHKFTILCYITLQSQPTTARQEKHEWVNQQNSEKNVSRREVMLPRVESELLPMIKQPLMQVVSLWNIHHVIT